MSVDDCQKIVQKALAQLDTVEQFAMHSAIHDHHLALQTMYRYCILMPERDLRTIFLDKVARFTAHFGYMPEIWSIHGAISDGTTPTLHLGRGRNSVLSCVFQARSDVDNDIASEDRSVIENIIYDIRKRCGRSNLSTEKPQDTSFDRRPLRRDEMPDQERREPMDPRLEHMRMHENVSPNRSSDRSSDSFEKRQQSPPSSQPQRAPQQAGVKFVRDDRYSNVTQDSGYHSSSGRPRQYQN